MRGAVVAVIGVVAILMGAGAGYLVGNANERTITSVSTTTSISTVASVSTATSISTVTLTTTSVTVLGSLVYISASDYCLAGYPNHYVPCWGNDNTGETAYVFNCTNEAATPQGCTQRVTSTLAPHPSYTINTRWPFTNSTEPVWANCLWAVGGAGEGYGYCASFNSTAFVMGQYLAPSTG